MEKESVGLDGRTIIALCTIIGSRIIVLGTWYGTNKNNKVDREEAEQRIKGLENKISLLDKENKEKQDSIESLSREILKFSSDINTNTTTIGELVNSIDEVTNQTKKIANDVKNEQKQRGQLIFKIPLKDEYVLKLGKASYILSREVLKKGYKVISPMGDLPIFLEINESDLLLSVLISDRQGNIICRIEENNWMINKNQILSMNYDNNGLEIIDEMGSIILQLDIKNDGEVKLNFYFFRDYNRANVFNNSVIADIYVKGDNFLESVRKVKPIFIHEGEDYLGKRIKL